MADTLSLEEIKTLKQRIANLERREETYKRSEHLLQALNQAFLAMSYATTPEEIFDTVAETLKGLGISSIIYAIDPDQDHLIVNSVTLDSKRLKAAEKIAGFRAVGLKVPIDPVDVLRISIRERKTHISRDPEGILRQMLPKSVKKFSGKLAALLDVPTMIGAPLISGDEVIGLLSVQSDELIDEDMPLITAFANQVASSWQKAKLFQQAQGEIAERTWAETALLAERDRAQRYLDIAGVILVALDEHGDVELVNQKGCDVLGYTEDQLIGENWFERVIPEEQVDTVLNTFNLLIQGEIEPVEYYENPVLTKGGEQRIIAWHNSLITDDRGKITGTLSSGEDITESRLAETALRESEERFRSIVQASPMGMHIYQLEQDGRLVFIGSNPAADKILWVDNSQFIGKTIEEAFPPLADTEVPERYRRTAAYGEPWQTTQIIYEDRWIAGAYEVYAVQTSPGRMAAIFLDITERKRALEEQDRLVNILEATSDVVGTTKVSGQLVYLNKAGRRMFGLEDDENLIDTSSIKIKPINEYLKIEEQGINAALLYGVWSGESMIIDPDGQEIPISIVLITHRDDEGNPEFFSAVIRDISELRQAEDLIQMQSTALDSAAAGIFITDHQGIIIWANPSLSEITGYELDEIIGESPEIFSSGEDPNRHDISKTISKGEVWRGEMTNRRKDGSTYFSEQTITPILNTNGRVTHSISIQQDVSVRKENERALKLRATQLALLNEIGEQIVAVLDLKRVFQRAVQLVQECFGYHHVGIFTFDHQKEKVVMRARAGGFNQLFPPDHALKIGQGMVGWVAENNQTLLSNDVTSEERYTNLYPDKIPTCSELTVPIHIGERVIGVLDAQSPVMDAFDKSDVTVMQTLADQIAIAIENARLHDAVRSELNERKRMETDLRESEAKYRHLFHSTNDAILLSHLTEDLLGKFIDANNAACQRYGYTRAEFIDHIRPQTLIAGEPDREYLSSISYQLRTENYAVFEQEHITKNGTLIPVEISSTVIELEGQPIIFSVLRDITERKQLDDALRNIAAGVSAETGTAFFEKLVEYLAVSLSVRYAFVAEVIEENSVQTIAVYANGKIEDNFRYALQNTPCANVLSQQVCCYPRDVQTLFPLDDLLTDMQADSYAGVPLYDSTGQTIGILVVMDDKPIENEDLSTSLLQIFAVRVAAEVERLQVEAEVQLRASQLSALNQMGQMVTSSLNIEQVLEQVIQVVPPLVRADGVSILLRDTPDELVFAAASGEGAANLPGRKIPAHVGIAGQVLKTGQSAIINSQASQKSLYREIETISGYHTQSLLAVPLVLSDEIIGVMEAVHRQPNAFSNADLQIIETAGAWASTAISNARQHAAIRRRLDETQALATINQALNETLDLDRLLKLMVDSIDQILPHLERVVVHLYDEEDATLVPAAVAGIAPDKKPYLQMQSGQGIAGEVIQSGLPINVRDTQDDQRFIPIEGASYLRSLLVVPVQSGGRPLGTISVSSTIPRAFTDEDEGLLTMVGVQAALAIESARLFEETQQRAQHLVLLNDITRTALQQPNLGRMLYTLAERIQAVYSSDGCYITLWDEQRGVPIPSAAVGAMHDSYIDLVVKPKEATLTKAVLDAGHAIKVNDTLDSELISENIASQFPDRSVMALPLIAGEQRLGAVIISYREPHAFTSEEISLGESIAQQTALAISKALLLDAEQNRRQEAEMLRDITTALTETLEIDQVLERILLRLEEAITYDSAAVLLLEGDQLTIVMGRGIEGFNLSIGQQLPATAVVFQEIFESRQPIIIQDVLEDDRWEDLDTAVPVRSWMGIPLTIQDEVIGYLTIDNWKPGIYNEQHLSLAQAFSNQASIALQNARLYAATRRGLAESNTLFHISNLIVDSAEPDVEAILHQVVDQLWQDFGYYHVHVYLIDQESGTLIANQGSGPIGAQLKERGYRFTSEEGIVGYAATVGEAFMTNNVSDVLFFTPNPLLPHTSAEIAAPLQSRDQILGVLDVLHQPPNSFDQDDYRFLTTVADQIAVVLDKALLYTELQEALEKEQRTRAQLVQTEKLAAMGRLIASVAHELNNPLQAIQNALYLVKLEENLSAQAKEDLQVAINEGTRMAGLIARLRDTYRPVVAADYQSESLNTLVEEVSKLIGTHLRHNNVSLTFTPDPDLPHTPIIRDQIKQVILNLCINAIESMPDGGDLTICSIHHPDTEEVHINVSDTGPGITPDVQARIFEPFFTTKEAGTGLGLAVSYEIAQNHGGNITAYNNPGPGSTFTLSIPCKQPVLE